jgi:hypothetical protein
LPHAVLSEDWPVADCELAYLTPEAKARVEFDAKLAAAGWAVQDVRAAVSYPDVLLAIGGFLVAVVCLLGALLVAISRLFRRR